MPPPLVAVTSPLSLVAANAPLALLLAGEREIPRSAVRVVTGAALGNVFWGGAWAWVWGYVGPRWPTGPQGSRDLSLA